MDYEKKYKEALSWMQSLYKGLHGATKEDAEHYFPELIESKDERIKKAIYHILYENYTDESVIKGVEISEIVAWIETQGELKEKPTKNQVWDYCNKISREWWQITMNKWETLTDEEKSKYNQFIGFNDFSDALMNITAGALFQLIDTGKLEYEEGSLLLEKQDEQNTTIKLKTAEESLGISSTEYNKIINECLYGESKPIDKVKQNSAWSEDDEKQRDRAIYMMEQLNMTKS